MTKTRIVLISLAALLVLVGCGTTRTGELTRAVITETQLALPVQSLDGRAEGPMYEISLTVPEDWLGQFEVVNTGNRITFNFLTPDEDAEPTEDGLIDLDNRFLDRAEVFDIEVLSRSQYWEQIGSYPEDYINIIFTADTYFIYYVPQFAYYSGLDDEAYETLTAAVPGIIDSFMQRRLDQSALAQN